MDMKIFLEQIAFVTVLFQKKWVDSESIQSVEKIAKVLNLSFDVVVFDNSPHVNEAKPHSDYINFNYIENKVNTGVSEAYNRAAPILSQKGKKWILITDSDFSFDIELLRAYYKGIVKYPLCSLFSPILTCEDKIISPYNKKFHRYKILKQVKPGEYNSDRISIINNGILCKTEVFMKTGGYNPSVMLDFSDDWFIRKYSQYYSSLVIIDHITHHKLSSFEKKPFFLENIHEGK
jgi:GT2 family glycosyltransferase